MVLALSKGLRGGATSHLAVPEGTYGLYVHASVRTCDAATFFPAKNSGDFTHKRALIRFNASLALYRVGVLQ